MTSDSVHRLVIADEEAPVADDRYRPDEQNQADLHIQVREIHMYMYLRRIVYRRYMAEILPIRRKTLSNQSINQSIN